MIFSKTLIWLAIVVSANFSALSQVNIDGYVVDAKNDSPLEHVNIGIKHKSIGTTSTRSGFFSISIPSENQDDTLTFSMVGYDEFNIPISQINPEDDITIRLMEKTTRLNEMVILGEKLVEKKYGIKKRGVIHFTDGIFKKDDSFEIGQVIKLGDRTCQITSVNIHINSSRPDSASFRINFYRFDDDDNRPQARIVEKNILQRHPILEGWLKFDLREYNILLKGNVFVAIEFIPESKDGIKQIFYEVKIGGTSKSFYRKNSLGQWHIPPHHYCLYVTALVDKETPEELDDEVSLPAITLKSDISNEQYSIFVRLPKDYQSNIKKKYPVVYHVDANAYFDPISSFLDRLIKRKEISTDAIVVGIGYENAYVMDSLRDRDYTFPKALPTDSFSISGGGERFYHFIKAELQPYIEMTYRTDNTNHTIMGHSLGGYFVLYALLKEIEGNSVFNNYVAASPSLSYYDNYISKQFQNPRHADKDEKELKLYLTMGELEIDEDPNNNFNSFGQILSRLGFIQLKSKVYKNLEHMGTAVPSFEDGLEFIMSSNRLD